MIQSGKEMQDCCNIFQMTIQELIVTFFHFFRGMNEKLIALGMTGIARLTNECN